MKGMNLPGTVLSMWTLAYTRYRGTAKAARGMSRAAMTNKNRALRPRKLNRAKPYPAIADSTVAPRPPAPAYTAVLASHCKNDPSSLLEKTSLRFENSEKGRANQKPNDELRLGAVLVEDTKIHQMGIRLNTANSPHSNVTMLTVRRRTP